MTSWKCSFKDKSTASVGPARGACKKQSFLGLSPIWHKLTDRFGTTLSLTRQTNSRRSRGMGTKERLQRDSVRNTQQQECQLQQQETKVMTSESNFPVASGRQFLRPLVLAIGFFSFGCAGSSSPPNNSGGANSAGTSADVGGTSAGGNTSLLGGTHAGGSGGTGTSSSFACGTQTCGPAQYCRAGCCATAGCTPGPSQCVDIPTSCSGTISCQCVCGIPNAPPCSVSGKNVQCGCA